MYEMNDHKRRKLIRMIEMNAQLEGYVVWFGSFWCSHNIVLIYLSSLITLSCRFIEKGYLIHLIS